MQVFKSNGKILLTGEYAVLDGAKSLALPTRYAQTLEIEALDEPVLKWKSFDHKEKIWFEADFDLQSDFKFRTISKAPEATNTAKRLQQIFKSAEIQRPNCFETGYVVNTKLDFNRNWGLGTSSTLINNIAQWLKINPYELLQQSFGGSGYDIAAAQYNSPITYQITGTEPSVLIQPFQPSFHDQLFFVYLNRKQNSREAIAHYRNQPKEDISALITKISGITEQVISCDSLEEFKMHIQAHEMLISKAINLPRIQQQLFRDFPGVIKSLGGWGGDFILATGGSSEKTYFMNKGYTTIFEYSELVY